MTRLLAIAVISVILGTVLGVALFDVPAHPCPPSSIMDRGEVKVLVYPGLIWDHYYTCRGPA